MNLHEGWEKKEKRWYKEVVFSGHGYCVCPGRPNLWASDFERLIKTVAYTSERGIDWDCTPVIERSGFHVFRGVVLEVDTWIYGLIMSIQQSNAPNVWIVPKPGVGIQ